MLGMADDGEDKKWLLVSTGYLACMRSNLLECMKRAAGSLS